MENELKSVEDDQMYVDGRFRYKNNMIVDV